MFVAKTNQANSAAIRITAVILSVLSTLSAYGQSPAELILQADQLGERSDWRKAGPLFAKAEAEYRAKGDVRNELYAKLGRLHRDLRDGLYRDVQTYQEDEQIASLGAPDKAVNVSQLLSAYTGLSSH